MRTATRKADLGPLEDFHDLGHDEEDFAAAVLSGLALRQKSIPSKYFYDERGSQLFEEICALEEYYPTRTETALLEAHGRDIAARAGEGVSLVEFGSGASRKVRIILDALQAPRCYIPVDISREHLLVSAQALAAAYPDLPVIPICADYTRRFALPEAAATGARLGFFPGSTIGNFTPDEAVVFLRRAADILGPGSGLLIGVDLKKDERLLLAAYNDSKGVTAAFNLNLLARINRELGGDFDLDGFAHRAFYDAGKGRIEMHLVSRRRQTVTVCDAPFGFAEGESIHTENSHKFTVAGFHALAARAGWRQPTTWVDPDRLFSIHYLLAG